MRNFQRLFLPDNTNQRERRGESGNVLFYILIAVALIAALSFAVSNDRGSSSGITKERASLAASEILEYANTLGSAVTQLKLRGCNELHLSFENTVSTIDYENGNIYAPTDGSCSVFNINGAGVIYKNPESEWLDNAFSDTSVYEYFGQNVFTASACLDQVGTGVSNCNSEGSTASDLLYALGYLKENICIEINNKIGYGTKDAAPPLITTIVTLEDASRFTGIYNSPVRLITADNSIDGQRTACVEMDDAFVFIKVLMAR